MIYYDEYILKLHHNMKKSTVIFDIVVVIAIISIGTYIFAQTFFSSDSMMKNDGFMMPKEDVFMEPTDVMIKKDDSALVGEKMTDNKMSDSRYVQYSKSVLDSTANTRRVLFFYASWCPTCKPANESFAQNVSKIPEDVTLIRVNYNDPETNQEEKELAKKYSITYQHTFVQIDNTGKEMAKWNGGQIDELLSKIK